MAFDAPRKTLDDIRRELDAEYGASAILDAQADRTAAEDTAPRGALRDPEEEATLALLRDRRPGGWGGYVIAGLAGCIAGQILILAALAALHYTSGSAVRASTPATSESPAERAPSASVASPPGVPPETRDAAPAPEPTVVVPPATQFAPPATAPTSKAGEPRASVAAVTMAQPATDEAKPAPRRSTRPTPPAPAAAPPAAPSAKAPAPVTTNSHDWARSQDEVRAALREWLARSHQNGADVRASDTVVILGADGRTAKSHVRMSTAGGTVVHEQRWKREANGWSLIENREAWRSDVAR
jgi:hypothetical protein